MRPNSSSRPGGVDGHPDGWSGGGIRNSRADRSVSAEMEAIFSATGATAGRQGQRLLAPGNHVRTIFVSEARPQPMKRVRTGVLLGAGAFALLVGSVWIALPDARVETTPRSETSISTRSAEAGSSTPSTAPELTTIDAPLTPEQSASVAPIAEGFGAAVGISPLSPSSEVQPGSPAAMSSESSSPAASAEAPAVRQVPPIESPRSSADRTYVPPAIRIPSAPDPEPTAEVAEPRTQAPVRSAERVERRTRRNSGATARPFTPAVLVKGRLKNSDYPRAARRAGAEGTVHVRFLVNPDGGVGGCTVTRSSGHPELDSTTCRLIERRFRYRPARDVQGRPTSDVVVGEQLWWIRQDD